MKTLMSFTMLILGLVSAQAQVNPKAGYIITNENDTVVGVIDYRSDARNAQSCLFSTGEDEVFREYTPQQIKGYRLLEDGMFYVTRTFPVDGVEKTFFAEFMVKGAVSLYRYRETGTDYFYLVDQDGKVATVRETGIIKQRRDDQMAIQRAKVQEASQIFLRSQRILRQLWTTPELKPDVMTRLTREYNQEVFPDVGETTVFQYGSRVSSSFQARLRVEAALGFDQMVIYPFDERNDVLKISSLSPIIGVGADMMLPRLSQHLVLQAMLYYSYNKGTKDPGKFEKNYTSEVLFHDVCLQVGLAYNFLPQGRISPIVRAGVSLDYLMGYQTEHMRGYYDSDQTSQDKTASGRYYGGAGAEFKIGDHKLSLTGNYVMRNFGTFGFRAPMFTINCGFIL